jgi:hypothetical protein
MKSKPLRDGVRYPPPLVIASAREAIQKILTTRHQGKKFSPYLKNLRVFRDLRGSNKVLLLSPRTRGSWIFVSLRLFVKHNTLLRFARNDEKWPQKKEAP